MTSGVVAVRGCCAAVGAVLVLTAGGTAHAEPVADRCNQVSNARKDLREVELVHSASSFSVRTTGCGRGPGPDGDWYVVVHLEGFAVPVQVAGVSSNHGKYVHWSGFAVCAGDACDVAPGRDGFLHPPGTAIAGPCAGSAADCQGTPTSYGHGAWADVLPPTTAVPDELAWWAEVRVREGASGSRLVDRVPETGTSRAVRNTTTVPTRLTVTSEGPPTWLPHGTPAYSSGHLTTAAGAALSGRVVLVRGHVVAGQGQVTGADGRWGHDYLVRRNTDVQAVFSGDGVHEPVGVPFRALVRGWVTLDLPEVLQVRRYQPVQLRGVVRPRTSGQVRVHVREARPGAPWRLLRHTTLRQGRYDSWWTTTWRPQVRGSWVLRAQWDGGTSEPGGVLSGRSVSRWVQVR